MRRRGHLWTEDLGTVGKGADKQVRQLLADLQAEGGWTGCLNQGHIKLRHDSGISYVMARTPSDARATVNSLADIRRLQRQAQVPTRVQN